MSWKLSIFALCLGLINSTVGHADDARAAYKAEDARTEMREAEKTLTDASEVYRSVAMKADKKVPSSVLKNAQCVAIFPNVTTAALVAGGMHGDGVAFCKSSATGTQQWSSPIFLNLTGGSIGAQAGIKTTDLVLYMTGDNARTNLQQGKFSLGGELSAVAGKYDETFAAPRAGVVAYSRTEGLFAGASLDGMNISRDEEQQKIIYGQSTQTASLFDQKIPTTVERSVTQLKGLLPS